MPEFILDHGSPEDAKTFASLDDFTQGYVEAAFFTETGTGDDEDLEHASFAELAPEALARIIADCAAWQQTNADLLAQAYERGGYDPASAGRDYWFTRNSHGVGFWDREPLEADGLGDKLSNACRYSSVDLYRGDDERLYLI